MNESDKRRVAASFAKLMALMCVRNTRLENIHAGVVPTTRTGDYSDVVVVDADGREIPWPNVSHIDNDEMRELMKEVVSRLYTFHIKLDDRMFRARMDRWATVSEKWDAPDLDTAFIRMIEDTDW